MTLWRLEGASLPAQSQGQIVPEYYGGIHKDIPGYPLQVGYFATLADNCGADTSQTTLLISGPELDDIRDALYPSLPVVAQLEGEWVLVSAFLESPWRLTVTRGYSSTAITAHPKGAEIYFIESRALYVFASAPPGCRYPDDAVIQLRINDVAQTPPCTVRLQDDRIVTGARFVTAEFDLSRAFGGLARPRLPPRRVVFAEPRPADAVGHQPALAPLAASRDLSGGARVSNRGDPGSGFRRWTYTPPPPPAAPPAPAIRAAPAASSVVSIRAAPLGDVTMDLRGLLDTPAGRYTGTGSAALRYPAAITQCLLESTYGESRCHRSTWMATDANQRQLNLRWRVAWRGEAFETFRQLAGFNGLADLWLDDDGAWRYSFQNTGEPVATLTPREILGEVAVGFIPPSATHLVVTWGAGLTTGTFTLENAEMIRRYGRVTDRALALPWIASEAIARTVATRWLPKWDRDRWTATVAVPPSCAALTRTDRVAIETPILAPYGLVWEIRGTTERGEQRVLTLIEGDAPSDALPGLLGSTVRGTATLTGYLMAEMVSLAGALGATAEMIGSLTLPTSAELAGTAIAMATLAGILTTPPALLVGAMTATANMSGTLTVPTMATFAHGALQWLAADAVSTVYTVSGLGFQPGALEFEWGGMSATVNAGSGTAHLIRGHGFAVGASARRAVVGRSNDGPTAAECVTGYRDDCVVFVPSITPGLDGALDLQSITTDGFTLVVDDQVSADLTIFYKAYGGMTGATVLEIAEPAATGTQDYSVPGFVAGASDQVVLFAGVQEIGAANTISRKDSGFCYGFAAGATPANVVAAGNSADAALTMVTGSYVQTGECLAMLAIGSGNPNARATLTQWNADGFRLNWLARGVTSRKSIALAMKGGQWAVGATTIASQTLNATATVSGLAFAPTGVICLTAWRAAPAAGIKLTEDLFTRGIGSASSSRRTMGHRDLNGSGLASINSVIRYDAILGEAAGGGAGTVDGLIDLNAMTPDGFQLIVDLGAAFGTNAWIGYLARG